MIACHAKHEAPMQAPVPYLNRAIAEEQLGVNAASAGRDEEAAQHYQAAIQVRCQAFIEVTVGIRLAQDPSQRCAFCA